MRRTLALAAMAVLCGAVDSAAQAPPAAVSAGAYTEAQAGRGEKAYAETCARCHGLALEGIDVAPALTGSNFLAHWTGQPIGTLAGRIRTSMPLDDPGVLGQAATADIVAYILSNNGYAAGATELPPDAKGQQALTLDAPGAGR